MLYGLVQGYPLEFDPALDHQVGFDHEYRRYKWELTSPEQSVQNQRALVSTPSDLTLSPVEKYFWGQAAQQTLELPQWVIALALFIFLALIGLQIVTVQLLQRVAASR